MTAKDKVARREVSLLELAKELDNVNQSSPAIESALARVGA